MIKMSANNLKFFDFEVFPNWWCCVVSDEEDEYPGGVYRNEFTKEDEARIKGKMRVYHSGQGTLEEVRRALVAEMRKGVLCGYNIKRYDLKILKGVAYGFTPQKLYMASEILVDDGKTGLDSIDAEHIRVASFMKFGWQEAEAYQDLMDDVQKTLKDKEGSLGMDIRETTVPFGKPDLTQEEMDEIIFYCKHDVYALHVYYQVLAKRYVNTKMDICRTFGFSPKVGYVNTNANLSGKVLEAVRRHGTTIKDPTITIRDGRLREYFEKWVPKEIYQHILKSQESREFRLYENIVSVGDGGLHSTYELPVKKAGIYVEATDEWTMYNIDASSCYVSVMLFCDAISRGISKPERLKEIYERRIKLKQTPKSQWSKDDEAFVAAAKLVLNTTYGAMGNKYLALYDDYMRSKTCRVGQLILIALGNCIYSEIPGLKVIQNNTDGILVYARRTDLQKIQELVDEFSEISHFTFEIEEDSRLWQLNVNNYVAIHDESKPFEGDNVKEKGEAMITSVFQPGYYHLRPMSTYCVNRAKQAFYIKGENPVKHLLSNTEVSDFCLACTKGPGYKKMIQHNKNGDVELGKVGRVIAVLDDNLGTIVKQKVYKTATKNHSVGEIKEDTVALCPPHPLSVNDALYNYYIKGGRLYHIDGRSWAIDYAYYCRELDKSLDVIWYKVKNENISLTKEFNL